MNLKLPRAKKRLTKIFDEVESLIDNDDIVADVGTDHGYLAVMIKDKHSHNKVIATDISKPSLEKAILLADKQNVDVDCRVGDGLIPAPEATFACVCGIGGTEIAKILEDVSYSKKAILQPVPTDKDLRNYLLDGGYNIIKDYVVKDSNKFYFIFVINGKKKTKYSMIEKYFGKTNIENMTKDFVLYLKSEVNRLKFLENFDITKISKNSKKEIIEKIKYYEAAKMLLKKE